MSIYSHVHMSTCPVHMSTCPYVHMSICLCSWPCPWTRPRTWTYRYMNYGHVDIWTFSMYNLHVHVNIVENTHWWNILVDSVLYGGAIFGRDLSPIGEKSRSRRFLKCWQVLTSVVKTFGDPKFRSKFFWGDSQKARLAPKFLFARLAKTSLAINRFNEYPKISQQFRFWKRILIFGEILYREIFVSTLMILRS
jgi:hypothetical protein